MAKCGPGIRLCPFDEQGQGARNKPAARDGLLPSVIQIAGQRMGETPFQTDL